jgi:hypothetical protein
MAHLASISPMVIQSVVIIMARIESMSQERKKATKAKKKHEIFITYPSVQPMYQVDSSVRRKLRLHS